MLKKKRNADHLWTDIETSKKKIVDAAIACFEKFGPQKTNMGDIAKAAGISRPTLYRVFEDRPSLVEAVITKRIVEMGARINRQVSEYENFIDSLVEGSLIGVAAGREDVLFKEILATESSHRVEQFLFRANDQLFAGMCALWFPLIDAGREEGVVKNNLTNEQVVEIIINIHALLQMRDDYGPDKQRQFLETVLVPAVTKQV